MTYAQLVADYPALFDSSFEFECGAGWLSIIRTLCENIQWHIDGSQKRHDWAMRQSPVQFSEICPPVTVVQVKEKFGTLRFYFEGGDDYIRGMVSMATGMSAVTCDTCGHPGVVRNGGWIRTLCDIHYVPSTPT